MEGKEIHNIGKIFARRVFESEARTAEPYIHTSRVLLISGHVGRFPGPSRKFPGVSRQMFFLRGDFLTLTPPLKLEGQVPILFPEPRTKFFLHGRP